MIALLAAVVAALPVFSQFPLTDAIARAIANSAQVAGAQATVREREADLRLARLGGIPHVTADYSLSPQSDQSGTATVEQHFITVGAGISVNDIFATSSTTREAAAELVAAQREADASALRARTSAIELYFGALSAIAVARVREGAVAGAKRELRAAQIRARAGEAPHLDALRAEVTLAQAQADSARAAADRANAVDALASATNVDTAAFQSLSEAPPETPAPELDERRAVERAFANRPELAALLASLDARTEAIGLARAGAMPVATLTGGYQAGVDTGVPVHGPQVAVHVDVPLASGAGDRVAAARAQADAVRAQLAEARRTIALDVAAAVRTARAADAALSAAVRARDEALRALSAVELGYREGASSSLDVDLARHTYVQASVDALVANYQRAQTRALLETLTL